MAAALGAVLTVAGVISLVTAPRARPSPAHPRSEEGNSNLGRARYRVTSSAISPRPSMANRMRSPGAGNLVVMLLPVMTIMSRVS